MDLDKVKKLMETLEKGSFKKVVYKEGDFELHLEKEGSVEYIPQPQHTHSPTHHTIPKAKDAPHSSQAEDDAIYISSPMVGTYYASPGPEQPPFVKVGDRVKADTIVCIVEAMKVMNEVKAGMDGIVKEIMLNDSQPVEFGTNIIRLSQE